MMKGIKKFAVVALAAVMTIAGTCTAFAATGSPTTSVTPVVNKKVTATVSADAPKAKVTTSKKGTATVETLGKTTAKTVKVASKVTVDGVSYTVTTLGTGAFAKCGEETKKVSLPKTITKIESKAFTGSSLKKIDVYSTKSITVSKTAFKGVDTKSMTIKVTKKMSSTELKKFKKALKAAGYKGKVVRMTKH